MWTTVYSTYILSYIRYGWHAFTWFEQSSFVNIESDGYSDRKRPKTAFFCHMLYFNKSELKKPPFPA